MLELHQPGARGAIKRRKLAVARGKAKCRLDFGLGPELACGSRDNRVVRSHLEILYVPNIASAKKNMRKSRAATVRNRAQRSALRTALKKAQAAESSPDERLKAVSLLDRAARKGLIHRNAAARHKSSLAKKAAAK